MSRLDHQSRLRRVLWSPLRTVCLTFALLLLTGCQSTRVVVPLAPLPMAQAIEIINRNTAKITTTLRAAGTVDGRYALPDGGTRSYHVDGVLFYLAPSFVRFDLKALGQRQFLFGSNDKYFWSFSGTTDEYHCGRLGEEMEPAASSAMPIRPDQLVDALGLTPVPTHPDGSYDGLMAQRVVAEYQQILFLRLLEDGRVRIEREYWLERYEPRLVRRVVFRDREGVVIMRSTLEAYRPMGGPEGPLLPHRMTAEWLDSGATMRFRVARWRAVPSVKPDGVQFRLPPECIAPSRSVSFRATGAMPKP